MGSLLKSRRNPCWEAQQPRVAVKDRLFKRAPESRRACNCAESNGPPTLLKITTVLRLGAAEGCTEVNMSAPFIPPPSLPAKKSNLGIVLVIVGVIICLAGGGYWFLGRSKDAGLASANPKAAATVASDEAPKVEVPLVKSIAEGRLDDAKQLLEKGADVNAANSDGTTALMQAAEGTAYLPNNGPTVTMLLAKGANVDAQDKRGRTALYRAAAEGQDEVLRILVGQKANLNKKADDGSTALFETVNFGKMPALKILLESGAEADVADKEGTTPLMIAASGTAYMPNNTPLVIALLEKNVKIDAQDSNGRTPLYRAATEGKTDAAALLLDRKANPNQKANNGSTPILEAVTKGYVSMAQLLIGKGGDVDLADTEGTTPLMVASEGNAYIPNNAPVVAALLAAHAKVDAQDSRGRTALYRASAEGKVDAMRMLLEKKANPNQKSKDGSTPLLVAVAGKLDAVTLLLDNGADANQVDANGVTPLTRAGEGDASTKDQIMASLRAHKAH
jgi:ankyrin repeat protein